MSPSPIQPSTGSQSEGGVLPSPTTRREPGAGIVVTGIFAAMILFMALLTGMVVIIQHSGPPLASASPGSGANPLSIAITLTDFQISPNAVSVAAGQAVVFHVKNGGPSPHNFALDTGAATATLQPGASADLTAGPFTQSLKGFCSIPGHKEAGMVMTIEVTGGTGTATTMAGMGSSTPTASTSADARIDFSAKPDSSWHAFDPTLAPAPGATVHNVTFHMKEVVREVAPGVTQTLWTFEGQVPGPTLRGHLGDVFNVTVVNDGTMTHSIDFHASEVAPNVAMAPIAPGKSLVYQFTANYSGIWMYHCGTAPALQHIANGMFGAVVIDPPGLPAVAHEYVVVQSELYLGAMGQAGDFTKMIGDAPDAVVFNGYVNQYKYSPLTANPGERIRIWVLDAGPNAISSFHIVGTIFDTVFKEGHYQLTKGNAEKGGSQVLDLLPAQGGFVELSFAQPGLYTMVTHKFADASRGALGIWQIGGASGTMNH